MRRNLLVGEAIQSWMARVMAAKPATPFDDLHIDEIDQAYKPRSKWLDGALECLQVAISIRDTRSLPVTVALGTGLKAAAVPLGVNFSKWTEVQHELDDSPPSLYLWRRDDDPLGINATRVVDLTDALVLPAAAQVRKMLSEWYDTTDGEFRRTLWLIA